jgi:hypothetical protein
MAYPAGTTVSYNNAPCLYLQTVLDLVAEEKEYTKANVGFIDLLQSNVNKENAPVKIIINNDGKTQDTSNPGKFDFVYYAQDCTANSASALGACTAASGGDSYAGKTTKQFTLDKTFSFSLTVNTQAGIDKCYTVDTIKAELFASKKMIELQRFEKQLLDEYTLELGKYASQTLPTNSVNSPAALNFLNPGSISSPNLATGLQVARQYLRQNNKNVVPLYLGQSVGLVEMQKEITPNESVFISDGLQDAMVDITGVSTVEYFHAIPAGTFQLATWNKYVGDYAVPMGTRAFTEKMTMDLWGFTWDVTYTKDLCNDFWHFQLNYGIVKTPNINCGDRDALNFLVGCGITECSDLQSLFGTTTSFDSGGIGA